ncbi:proline-rich receptor-like protein kinase PERK4 [Humulus lupulus]|uniref:proline-rich receptor-like protein kinase PERK4 n=1 Tax=Humulus lupulus TaxID=3486 RepID=UPI002B4050D6|nr:proline-rich receptor-like protein kinase PERK4 [Humulus lupulus]
MASSSPPSPSGPPPLSQPVTPPTPTSSPPPQSSSASPPPPPPTPPPPLPPTTPLTPSPSPPPPADDPSLPPPSDGSSLNQSPPLPPPPQPNDSSQPPPKSPDSSPPPPPAPNAKTSPTSPGGSNNDFHSPPPPPPLHHSPSNNRGESSSPPPPPPRSVSSSKAHSPASNGSSTNTVPIIIGVVAGAGLLLLVVALFFFFSCAGKRKKKAQAQMHFGPDNSRGPSGTDHQHYTSSQRGHNQNWQNGAVGAHSNDHVVNVLTSPPVDGGTQGVWPAPPPPPIIISSDMSSTNFSGPLGPVLPPPPPSVALGFNKSTFTYDELLAATAGFAQANLLGQGGFGYVHKGVLPNGKEIAVKSLKSGSSQGDSEFQAEVEIISRVHHRHLVSLVGYCLADTGKKMLVYEFLPNNNLEVHLHDKGRSPLDWTSRVKIAIGSAKGLAYLHEDCHPRIIHRDIKTSNILLESNFEAKVADFGLVKLSQDNNTHVSTRVMGTFGYLAPEYASTGKLTEKSDVFSFGVVLLELITGRRPVDTTGDYMEDSLVDWARPLCLRALENGNYDEIADPRLQKSYDPMEMASMVASASASIRHSARRRPKMSQIVRALEGDVSLEDLNEGVKGGTGQCSSYFRSGSENYDVAIAGSYSASMNKLRKKALNSQEYASSEYGGTSEYGLDPSSSSDSSPDIIVSRKGSRSASSMMFAAHIAALVVSASSEKYAASETFVVSASFVASVTEKLETSEAIASSSASLLVNCLATVTSSGRMTGTFDIVEIEQNVEE